MCQLAAMSAVSLACGSVMETTAPVSSPRSPSVAVELAVTAEYWHLPEAERAEPVPTHVATDDLAQSIASMVG